MPTTTPSPAQVHANAIDELWDHVATGRHRVAVGEAAPGAGKSTGTRELARRQAARSQAAILTQTNAQADDMVRELAATIGGAGATIGRLHRSNYPIPDDVDDLITRRIARASTDVGALAGCDVVVAPAHKWAHVDVGQWQVGLIDEAFQMRSDLLMAIADRFDAFIATGDAGQLNPWTASDERLVKGAEISPLATAAATLRASHPATPVVALPVTWRLQPNAARVVSRAFYANEFHSGATRRGIHLPTGAIRDSIDGVIRVAATGGWGLLELDPAFLPHTDPEAVEAIAAVIARLLTIGATFTDGPGPRRRLEPRHIAVGVTHRDQRAHVRRAVDGVLVAAGHNPGDIVVDTANSIQGRQFQVVVAWHPLSGRRDATSFHLESGRLCVLMSRHRQACIVVTRGGIREQLEAYPGTDPMWLGEQLPAVDGWTANLTAIDELSRFRVQA